MIVPGVIMAAVVMICMVIMVVAVIVPAPTGRGSHAIPLW